MIRKLITMSVLSLIIIGGFTLAGCQVATPELDRVTAMSPAEKAHYTDDKGRFHADLAIAGKPIH